MKSLKTVACTGRVHRFSKSARRIGQVREIIPPAEGGAGEAVTEVLPFDFEGALIDGFALRVELLFGGGEQIGKVHLALLLGEEFAVDDQFRSVVLLVDVAFEPAVDGTVADDRPHMHLLR